MIKILDTGGYQHIKQHLEDCELSTNDEISIVLAEPCQILFNQQKFTLDYKDRKFQSLLTTTHPLLTALGNTKGTVLDACGGFGKDSFILAHNNFKVTTCEENPFIATILTQAVTTYCQYYPIQWQAMESKCQSLMKPNAFDLVYLDPMFQVTRSSKPKLGMQIIQSLSKQNEYTDWQLAFSAAKKKLVIKQHNKSPVLTCLPKPSLQISGKQNIRYDIYHK